MPIPMPPVDGRERRRSLIAHAIVDGLILVAIALLLLAGPALAKPALTASGGTVIALSNLASDEGCQPARMSGTVLKRAFGRDGLFLQSVVVEERSGQRSVINVDDGYRSLDAASSGAVKQALDTLLTVGRKVSLRVLGCGAAGRTLSLDAVKPL